MLERGYAGRGVRLGDPVANAGSIMAASTRWPSLRRTTKSSCRRRKPPGHFTTMEVAGQLQRLVRPETPFSRPATVTGRSILSFHPSQPTFAIGTDDFNHCPTIKLALPEPVSMPPNG
ncbi:hypothetical protein [Zavarzinella formosa]|uniref:hypothetical protein n=1 Tax=Zavarzinella formosa TaxID=360055 RepID=UPI0002DB48B0|nr:hypothetical protein [Zavarzinella formosa]